MIEHRFGGDWTSQKLEVLRQYLTQYRLIFRKAPRAQYFLTIYVDAFAGSGERIDSEQDGAIADLIGDPDEPDRTAYKKGSASIALELADPFDQYCFVEKSAIRAMELQTMIAQRHAMLAPRCTVAQDDANSFLQKWAKETDWRRNRTVVFLDPYGMVVEWNTIASLAATKAIDLWVLFPVGAGVNRLAHRERQPPREWEVRLTSIFGTEEWQSRFYAPSPQRDLFDSNSGVIKDASFQRIGEFFLERLQTVFTGVARNAMPLENSRRNAMYWLCFAAGNPRGAPTAIKIADYLLSQRPRRK